MNRTSSSELGTEVPEVPRPGDFRLESLDDIPREIARRRLDAAFGHEIPPERSALLREQPDKLESPELFDRTAREAGVQETEGLLGWVARPEDPAHVLKGDVGREIATLIHEDLHRVTHPETLRQAAADPAVRELYEGLTEHFTGQAAAGLHGFLAGEVYPEAVEAARRLAGEVGDRALREWFFENELSVELQRALEQIQDSARK